MTVTRVHKPEIAKPRKPRNLSRMWITRISWFPKSKKSMSKSTIIECTLDREIHKIHEIQINRTHPLAPSWSMQSRQNRENEQVVKRVCRWLSGTVRSLTWDYLAPFSMDQSWGLSFNRYWNMNIIHFMIVTYHKFILHDTMVTMLKRVSLVIGYPFDKSRC